MPKPRRGDADADRQRPAGRTAALCQIRERHPDRDRPLARRLFQRVVAPLAAARAGAARRRTSPSIWSRARASRRRARGSRCARPRIALEPLPFLYATVAVAAALGDRRTADRAHADSQPVDGVSAGGAVDRRELRHLAGDLCLGAVVPGLQFLLHRAALHLHRRRAATNCWRWSSSWSWRSSPRRWPAACASRPRSRPAACGRCGGSMNSPAGCRGWRRSMPWPKARPAKSTPASAAPVVVLLEQDGDLELTAAWPPEDALDAAPMTAARWAFSHGEPAGADTGTLADRAVVLRAAADRRQDARRHRRRQAGRDGRRSIRKRARCSIRCPSRPPPRWSAPRSRARW